MEINDVVIDVPLVMEPALWPACCIYRVPKKLRKLNKEAYIPMLVSIGPFHHRRKELEDMEKHKLRFLKDFLYRTGNSQEDLLKIIQDNEVKIRHCYSEDCRLNTTDFVKMILLDAIFIIELFLRFYIHIRVNDENDYISNQPWLRHGLRHDLILLETQLPFLVLEELYTFAFSDSSNPDYQVAFLVLTVHYFSTYFYRIGMLLPILFNIREVNHFTDLIRYAFCSVPALKPTGILDNLCCATKFDEAGLKFKAVEKRRLLDITFAGNECLKYCPCFNFSWLLSCLPCFKCFSCLERMQCILEFGPLKISDSTETLFRNVMALEQCHYRFHAYICNYVLLMDYLIDTEQDVELLVEKKIIVNNIGSNAAVATLFNKLSIGIMKGKSCYYDLGREINGYRDNHWNHIMATMKSTSFRDFWRGTETVVGLTVLGFTLWSFLRHPSVT